MQIKKCEHILKMASEETDSCWDSKLSLPLSDLSDKGLLTIIIVDALDRLFRLFCFFYLNSSGQYYQNMVICIYRQSSRRGEPSIFVCWGVMPMRNLMLIFTFGIFLMALLTFIFAFR